MIKILRPGSPICEHKFKVIRDNKGYCPCGQIVDYSDMELVLATNRHRAFLTEDKDVVKPTVKIKYEGYIKIAGI